MRTRFFTGTIVGAIVLLGVVNADARKTAADRPPAFNPIDDSTPKISLDTHPADQPALRAAAAAPETTWLASWTFDGGGCDTEGWTAVDWTAQDGDFWHVDDFVGVGTQIHGLLYAPQGNQAMWCGARPDPLDETLCRYATLPGYGNSWDQSFVTVDCLDVTGDVRIHFLSTWDSEAGYDGTCVEFDKCDDDWINIQATSATYYFSCIDGWDADAFDVIIPDSLHSSQVRIRFHFRSDGAWSDADGLWNTDGAIVIDSLSVTDDGGPVLPTELFEAESVGDHTTVSGNWTSEPKPGFGSFAGLFPGVDVLQEDPCAYDATCLWGFFNGSTYNYSCGGHAEQAVVPYGPINDRSINESIVSPWVPIAGAGTNFTLAFDVYRDLPLDALVFYNWWVQSRAGSCPLVSWKSRDSIGYYGGSKDWMRSYQQFGDLVAGGATEIRVALTVRDMCPWWCGLVGTGSCHTQSPLFDNVDVYRVDSQGPVFETYMPGRRLFQDNFPSDGTSTGTVRADIAQDILPSSNPNIRPGDSTVVAVSDPEVGLAGDSYTSFGPAVYAYVGVWPQGQPGKGGDALTQDSFRWPVVDSFTHNGDTWYCVRVDTSFTNSVARSGIQPNTYCVDLNDNLFMPGDTVCYVFAATSNAPVNTTRYYSYDIGTTEDLGYALDNAMEFTCLPTGNADILYVDDYDGYGAQPFFDTAFDLLGIAGRVDRYDVIGPANALDNGPGSRVVDVSQQLLPVYGVILWNSGAVGTTIGDGNDNKSNDAGMLLDFLDGLTSAGGLYLSGDNIAEEWPSLVGDAVTLKSTYIDHVLTSGDHYAYGQAVSPLVFGEAGGCFDGDALIAFGGCPGRNDFDVIAPQGGATLEASYGSPGSGAGAIVAQKTINPQATEVGVILSGFSFHEIRDIDPDGVPARSTHLDKVLAWLGVTTGGATAAGPAAYRNALAQNYPNPFNPATTLEFTVREKAPVTLRVYNVRGQLVRTLVDDVRAPGIVHRIEWDGRNDAGQRVASGVYFYRMSTREFTRTRKMVVLK